MKFFILHINYSTFIQNKLRKPISYLSLQTKILLKGFLRIILNQFHLFKMIYFFFHAIQTFANSNSKRSESSNAFFFLKKKKTCVAQECMNHQGNDELCRLWHLAFLRVHKREWVGWLMLLQVRTDPKADPFLKFSPLWGLACFSHYEKNLHKLGIDKAKRPYIL